jgi:hypothetical protein
MLASMHIPLAIRVSYQLDDNLLAHDMYDSREDLLNVLPVNHTVSIDVVAGDCLGSSLSGYAEELSLHRWFSITAGALQEEREGRAGFCGEREGVCLCVRDEGVEGRKRGRECGEKHKKIYVAQHSLPPLPACSTGAQEHRSRAGSVS